MKSFKSHLDAEKKKSQRKDHLVWRKDDLHFEDDENREDHFSWKKDDVEHVKEDRALFLQPHETPEIHHDDIKSHVMSQEEKDHHWEHKNRLYKENLESYVHYYKKDSSSFNNPLRKAAREYRQGGHLLVPANQIEYIHHLGRVVSNPTKHNMTVFRGIDADVGLHKRKIGSYFQDHGFTGTSLQPHQATDFSVGKYYPHHGVHPSMIGAGVLARIHVPKGTLGHHLDIDPDSPHRAENEFLLHRGTRFKVMGHSVAHLDNPHEDRITPYHIVDLHVDGQHPKKLIKR